MGKNIMVFTLGGQSFGLEAVKVESILHQPPVKAFSDTHLVRCCAYEDADFAIERPEKS